MRELTGPNRGINVGFLLWKQALRRDELLGRFGSWLCKNSIIRQARRNLFASSSMAAIDAALPSANLSKIDMAKVKDLRAKGEKLHKAGNHAQSVKALGEAKMLLGLKSM